jgi:hypothetical protein
VKVTTTRDPVDKSYRKMIKGMERFEREHAFAPNASLRFQLLPRTPDVNMDGITLRVAGDTVSVPVPIALDNSFVLPRNEQALREDAAVLANRKTTSMTWRAMIADPGLPPGTRRLGDLRLECRVGVEAGLVSNSSPTVFLAVECAASPDQVCNSPNGNYLFFAERPICSACACAPAPGSRSCPSSHALCRRRTDPRDAALLRLPGPARPHLLRAALGQAAGPTTRWSSSST